MGDINKDISLPVNYETLSTQERREVRQEYVKRQKGLCSHCKAPLTEAPAKKIQKLKIREDLFPVDFLKWPVHLHHDHETGMTIGAVHAKCNAVLWQYYGE